MLPININVGLSVHWIILSEHISMFISCVFHKEIERQQYLFLSQKKPLIFPTYFSTLFTESLQSFCKLDNYGPHFQMRKKSSWRSLRRCPRSYRAQAEIGLKSTSHVR